MRTASNGSGPSPRNRYLANPSCGETTLFEQRQVRDHSCLTDVFQHPGGQPRLWFQPCAALQDRRLDLSRHAQSHANGRQLRLELFGREIFQNERHIIGDGQWLMVDG